MTTGPFTKENTTFWSGSSGARKRYENFYWYRNGPGPKVPHTFRLNRAIAGELGTDAPNEPAFSEPLPSHAEAAAEVHNRCYDKYVNATRSASAQLGASLGEWAQSERMIVQRGGQLVRAARALKRGYPFEFFRELGMLHKAPKRLPNRSDPAKAADLWLEWHFGWVPLIGDLYSSVVILQSPVPSLIKVRVRASSSELYNLKTQAYSGWSYHRHLWCRVREEIGAMVRISNPNLWRANQLGLTNPISIAWELVPFSFVIDWFVPVGRFLEGWSDTLGLSIEQPYTTTSREMRSEYNQWTYPPVRQVAHRTATAWKVSRDLHILGPTLTLRSWNGISLTRAATAISLLLQQLKRMPG